MDFIPNLIEQIKNIISSIADLPGKIINGIIDALKTLFVPGDNFFKDNFDNIYAILNDKFNLDKFRSAFDTIMHTDVATLPSITITLFGMTMPLMDFSYLASALPTIHLLIRGAFYYHLIRYHIANVYKLIRGDDLA